MTLNLINPEDFKVARVITFRDEFVNKTGRICYMRPYTQNYTKDTIDDFDHSMVEWLESLNLNNVRFIHNADVLFDCQLPDLSQIYNGGRPSTKLSLACYGDYSHDEVVARGHITAIPLNLNVFWDANQEEQCPRLCGMVTFDKTKENYYRDVIKTITSLK